MDDVQDKEKKTKHPFYCALTVPYVPLRATRGALVAHRYIMGSSLQNLTVPKDSYFPRSISVALSFWPSIRWCGTGGFESRANKY